ncbi:related to phosphoglycerate mutase family domain protein [Rhynchosporium agropyri]|uniref:Related to phosphoglycerate mutase family domain protein n=1 Tax=Rhynchosporium agropyri TaxID=914238 RepID=A0A1E1LD64_9HELO|nr:related to phosphoglycerate mutase family domain protein [Rhynchosporium agropyri]
MGKPRMIILIRHAQSEGNKNRDIHQTIPDHRVKLTTDGWTQAQEAGRRLRTLLRADDTLHFFTSPYRRTRETTEGILSTLTSDEPSPTPFPRQSIKVYEEPRLREQDFGNFQPCSAEMERMWQERADYGHFFYRIPNGESAADAYDRVSGFNESLWRQFGEDDFASVCVLVTHGLMSRVFLMKWYHFSVEYFEDLRNVNHCEFLIMRKKEDSGKYILENNLRTWSELKRERLAAAAAKGKTSPLITATPSSPTSEKDKEKEKKILAASIDGASTTSLTSIPVRKKWGGCPNGCDHGKHYYKKENSMHAMQLNGRPSPSASPIVPSNDAFQLRRPAARRWQSSSEEDEDDPRGGVGPPHLDVKKSLDEVISSPDGTPSFISMEDRMRGNNFSPQNNRLLAAAVGELGSSASGNTSQAGSDTEFSAEEDTRKRLAKGKNIGFKATGAGHGAPLGNENKGLVTVSQLRKLREESNPGRGALADALGDQSDVGSDAGSEAEPEILQELTKEEKVDKSIQGSVY